MLEQSLPQTLRKQGLAWPGPHVAGLPLRLGPEVSLTPVIAP